MATRTGTASSRAYEQLRSEILDGRLGAGATLFEVEQAARLGVSRTPVREAISRLVADGLVEPRGGRGNVVTGVSEHDVESLFELRACLEAQAAQLAALRGEPSTFTAYVDEFRAAARELTEPGLTDEQVGDYYALIRRFDDAIDRAAANPYLVDAMSGLRVHVARVRRKAGSHPERLAASASEHALIATAIAKGDTALALHATTIHLHNSLEHFREAFHGLGSTD
jgi:DNA-binding GntR family transcriptional regulator